MRHPKLRSRSVWSFGALKLGGVWWNASQIWWSVSLQASCEPYYSLPRISLQDLASVHRNRLKQPQLANQQLASQASFLGLQTVILSSFRGRKVSIGWLSTRQTQQEKTNNSSAESFPPKPPPMRLILQTTWRFCCRLQQVSIPFLTGLKPKYSKQKSCTYNYTSHG